ncbi:MAG: flavin reductase family protein [Chloroflexi bacterium]|nr:flavin reductase family protein [Chloroflexota bacterium]
MVAIDPKELSAAALGRLLTAAITPRAIGWISTRSTDGIANLAPFSFFTGVSYQPPTVLFCVGQRNSQEHRFKDTLQNVQETGEFAVNFVTETLAEAMNLSAVEAPPQVDEFLRAGVTAAASQRIQAPHVAESPLHFECKLQHCIATGAAHIVIGEVIHARVDAAIYAGDGRIRLDKYQPIGRTSGPGYILQGDRFEMRRPPPEIT